MVLEVRESCITSGRSALGASAGEGGRTVTRSHQLGKVGNDSIVREQHCQRIERWRRRVVMVVVGWGEHSRWFFFLVFFGIRCWRLMP